MMTLVFPTGTSYGLTMFTPPDHQRPQRRLNRNRASRPETMVADAMIETLIAVDGGRAADRVLKSLFDRRRWDQRDRARIARIVLGVSRRRRQIDWWIARTGVVPAALSRLVAALALIDREEEKRIKRFLPALPEPEQGVLDHVLGHTVHHPEQPLAVAFNVADWLMAPLEARFGKRLKAELAAMTDEAGLDLRVNALKSDRTAVIAALGEAGVAAIPTPMSPFGLRVEGRPALARTTIWRDGAFEIQDEASQLAALLVGAQAGERVLDLCAGAGGKTLALAAAMANKGRLVATDVDERRLGDASARFRRAGVHNAETRLLATSGDQWLRRQSRAFDRVLVDVPCTGTGTWRRSPDAKWRTTPEELARLTTIQSTLLDRAAPLVKPGGRLVYATCSVLIEEDEAQVNAFLARTPDFTRVPLTQAWSALGEGAGPCPETAGDLLLTPARNRTDGFYAAILTRSTS